MNLHLTNKEFEETFGYSYDKLNIKLETSKDSENLERLIIIKDLSDLKNISNSISEVSYNDGYDTHRILSNMYLKI